MNLSEALVTGGEEGGCCLCGLNAWTLDMGSADSFVLQFANNKPWPWSYSYSPFGTDPATSPCTSAVKFSARVRPD